MRVNQAHWRRNIYLFLTSQFLTGITSMIVQYAIIWYLTKETGSATILSIATILGMLPMALLSPFVGPLVDRWNKKALLIVPDVVAAIFAIILSVSGGVFHVFPIWLIFVSLLMRSIAQTFQMPTIQSVMPTMVPDKELTKLNGQLGMVQSANMIIAPALGAFLFAIIPLQYLILLDVLGAILGISILIWVQIPNNEKIDAALHMLHNTKLGVQQLMHNKGLWYITITGAVFTLLYMPAASMYPLMTMKYFQGTVGQAGFIEALYSGGMLVGGAIIGIWGKWSDRMKPVIIAFFLVGIPTGLSGLLPGNQTGFMWFAILNVVEGIATPFFNTLLMAMIQQSYPPQQLGRVLGVLNSLMSLTGPIGLIFAGPLADALGVEMLFVIAGIGTVVCGIFALMIPIMREYDLKLQARLAKED
ncbi:MFS transporter [Lentilactobacillus buchneri]|uniref:H+ antiporter protein n=1 Tax=Lentilactobacillus buchneri subsp. silagei CD034 TaxID=1071400 RepID=J9W305_LENBU|nr:MFS transporter [Lentilactobacillus buchneri]MCC6101087.1 MFS transporter [Lactobacillus sp.]AFS00868.1 H+ antiporter protein [Lentilactobacillus buchneri subsp. silagei CD034]MCT2899996.1 MFS transporter [Lentilactobacillus buchneri]MCT3542404.1 MFS transporter [Lentilactobacillus buchneri]MCT3545453.1 MFS transporter [Lentilactobacillus buchneri]